MSAGRWSGVKGTWLMLVALVMVCASQQAPPDGATRPPVAEPEKARGQAGFVAYVEQLPDGSAQAVIYYPAQDRTEILVTTAPTKPSPFVWILPSDVVPCSPYDAPARDGKETTWVPVRDRYVYLDSVTGKVVSPDAHLGIDTYRRQLIDLVDDRALVLEYETDCEPLNPSAKLHLFRGTDSTELGRMFVEFIGSSSGTICYSLSPDRDHVSWRGPDGSYWSDLRTGRTHTLDSGERGGPDGSGVIREWRDDAADWHWEVLDTGSEWPVARGLGRIDPVSPGRVYWTIFDADEEHVLVLAPEADDDAQAPTARLYLPGRFGFRQLGRVFVEWRDGFPLLKDYCLSPDRDYLSWTGPEGSWVCKLAEGEVFPQWREHRWLADGSGFVEQWEDYLAGCRWNLFDADGEQPIASGKGRIGEISPDCVYWTIVSESWTRVEYRAHHDPPRVIRIIPGRQPSPETQIAEGPWAIDGSKVRFFAAGRRSASETIVFRITPEGHDSFVVSGKWHGEPRVLQLEDGGRIGMILRPPSSATRIDQTYSAAHDDELVVFDFDGSEKLRTDATILPDCHTVDGDSVLVVDRTPKDWRITRVNFRTGDVGLLLTCHGSSMDVHRIGASYLAMVGQGKKMPAPWDVYVGKSNERSWRFVAQNVRNIRWGPAR